MPLMRGHENSDPAILAMKGMNEAGLPAAELVERSPEAKGNANQLSPRRAQDRESVSQALERVRQAARQGRKNDSPCSTANSARSSSSSVLAVNQELHYMLQLCNSVVLANQEGNRRICGPRLTLVNRSSTGER